MTESADVATDLFDVTSFEREIFLESRGGHRAACRASRTGMRRNRRSRRTWSSRRAFVAEVDPDELALARASLAQGDLKPGTEPRRLLLCGARDNLHREHDRQQHRPDPPDDRKH